jgi:hypothetical protein
MTKEESHGACALSPAAADTGTGKRPSIMREPKSAEKSSTSLKLPLRRQKAPPLVRRQSVSDSQGGRPLRLSKGSTWLWLAAMNNSRSSRGRARTGATLGARAALGPAVAAAHSTITRKGFFTGWHPPRGLQILSYRRTAVCGFNCKSRSTSREFLVIKTHRLSDASKKSKQSFRNRRRSCFGMPWVRDRIPAITDASSQTS